MIVRSQLDLDVNPAPGKAVKVRNGDIDERRGSPTHLGIKPKARARAATWHGEVVNVMSPECPDLHNLHAFCDGELRGEDAERFREHLATCEQCAAELPRILELMAACEEIDDGSPVPAAKRRSASHY